MKKKFKKNVVFVYWKKKNKNNVFNICVICAIRRIKVMLSIYGKWNIYGNCAIRTKIDKKTGRPTGALKKINSGPHRFF